MRPRRTHFQKDSTDQLHHDVSVDSLGICGTNLGELAVFTKDFEENGLLPHKSDVGTLGAETWTPTWTFSASALVS